MYNTYHNRLQKLAKRYRPLDTYEIRIIFQRRVNSFPKPGRHSCNDLISLINELWEAGVFHWDECREIVLGSLPPAEGNMAKGRGNKQAQKARKRQRKQAKDAGKALPTRTTPSSQKPKYTHRDFDAVAEADRRAPRRLEYGSDRVDAPTRTFNPSTANDHEIVDLTMVDPSPVKVKGSEDNDALVEAKDDVLVYGIDKFLDASARDRRDRPPPRNLFNTSEPKKSLEDLYAEYPETRLTGIDEGTLEMAGLTAKQVVVEATHEFLQTCIPADDRQKVWAQVLGKTNKDSEDAVTSIPVPDGTLDLEKGARNLYQLMTNCITTLSSSFATTDHKTLKLVYNRCITLCHALDDSNRRASLEKALNALEWMVLGLDVKTTHIYRAMKEDLTDIDTRFWMTPAEDVARERDRLEHDLLRSHQKAWEAVKAPFKKGFLESLQRLMLE